uniref:HTH OST-type domain-containing protein n=1 Tax=Anopheles christyi TaxID=43041 RepID=A0A182JWN0_9DIPT
MMNPNRELDKLKPIIRCLVMSHPNHCVTLAELERDFRNTEGYRIPYARLGYPSVYHLLCYMKDTVQVRGECNAQQKHFNKPVRSCVFPANGCTMVKYVSTPAVAHVEQLLQNTPRHGQRKERQLQVKFKVNVHQKTTTVIRNGVPEKQYCERKQYNGLKKMSPQPSTAAPVVQSKTSVALPMRDNNCERNAVDNYRSPKKSSQPTVQKEISEKEAVTAGKRVPGETETHIAKETPVAAIMIDSCEHVDGSIASSNPNSNVWDWVNMLDIPSDVMGLSRTIPKVDVLSYFVERELTNVRVLHMLNPNRLWLRSVAQEPVIEKLYDELNECYNQIASDRWCLEANKVQHGLYCAVLWAEIWQRGRIVGPLIGCRVKVYFIDTGITELVDYQHLKFLSNVFSNVPAQAVRASLACLIPTRGAWTRTESDRLARLINFLNVLDIILKQSTGAWLNEKYASLISAQWNGHIYLSKNPNEYRYKKHTFNEKYPSFFCIEEGHFPTMEEIRKSLARGFDYEELYSRIPHVEKNGIVEQITRNTCEVMVRMFDIKVISENVPVQKSDKEEYTKNKKELSKFNSDL